jgi:hypothetical protein
MDVGSLVCFDTEMLATFSLISSVELVVVAGLVVDSFVRIEELAYMQH